MTIAWPEKSLWVTRTRSNIKTPTDTHPQIHHKRHRIVIHTNNNPQIKSLYKVQMEHQGIYEESIETILYHKY